MDISEIISRINENSHLLSEGSISEIERDILLEDLRSLYLLAKHTEPIQQMVFEYPKTNVADTKPVTPVKEEVAEPVIEQKVIEVVVKKEEPKPISIPVEKEPVVAVETIRYEEVKVKTSSLNEIFAGEERSLNQRLSGDKKPALNDHAVHKDLKSMIDFNKQYLLTNELFKGDSQAFNAAISHINETLSLDEAFEYIKTELMPKYKWNGELQSTRLFDKLVRQKFGLI